MNTRHSILTLALTLALAAPAAYGLGLGQLQVKSGLNQPLVAEIPIISATPSELDQLDVRLASPEAFASVGLDRPIELTANLQFSVGKNARGQPVIRVSTPSRFVEPFLSFLIEAHWGKGTVTREYTALIDPPYIAQAIVRPMEAPVVVSAPPMPPPVELAPQAMPEPVVPQPAQTSAASEAPPAPVSMPAPMASPPPEPVAIAPAPKPSPVRLPPPPQPTPQPQPISPTPPAPAATGQYGPVAAGQTLWSIASSARPDASLSVNQMMLAILRANPEAFDQDNINRLKSGSVLRIPDQNEVSRLTAAQAAALVHEQAAAWRAPRAPVPQPAEIASTEPQKPSPAAAPPVVKPVAKPIAEHTGTNKARKARLEIVPPAGKISARSVESGAATSAGGTELRAQLTQAREELAASQAEATELRSRVSDLEKQQSERQRLIDLQNSHMKELQDRLQQLEEKERAAAAAPAPVAPAAVVVAEKPGSTTPEKPAVDNTESTSSWYSNPYLLGGAGLVLLGGLVFALRRSKRKPEAADLPIRRISDDDALHASLAASRGDVVAPAVVQAATAEATAADKQLVALTTAVRSRPSDLETHLSLLRYLHTKGDSAAYESAAQAMRMHVVSTTDPRWREAVVMGAALLPGHPLFSQAGWNSPRFNETDDSVRPAAAAVAVEEPIEAEPMTRAQPATAKVASPVEKNRLVAAPAPVVPTVIVPLPPVVTAPSRAEEAASALATEMNAAMPPMDIHRSEAEVLAEDEASATRIELAKAYLDIGDLEGARSMLEEVMADGGPAAKAVAERILKEIG